MTLFRFRSVRSRMIATTALAFVAVVAILSATTVAASRGAVRASMEAELRRRAEDFARVVRRDLRPGRGDFGGPPGGGPPEGGPNRGGPGQGPTNGHEDWTAPAHIFVGREAGAGSPNTVAYDPKGYADAARGHEGFTVVESGDEAHLVYSTPVQKTGKVKDVVQVAAGMREMQDQLDVLRATLLGTVVPMGLLLGGLASFLVVGGLLRPLRNLNDEARRLGREGFGERLRPQGEDEFASLTHTLNDMVGDLETVYRSEYEAKERLQASVEQMRRFTGDASHEIKTPLAVLKAHLGILKRSKRNVADETETIQAMERATDRMNGLVQGLLVLARTDSGIAGERAPVRLDEALRDAAAHLPGSEGRVCLHTVPATVMGSPDELFRLFSNLIENALKHSGAETPVEVELAVRERQAFATIVDHGVGIASEHLPHLFERFYRVDRSRASATGGAGLGLAICEGIAQGHGGAIAVESTVGKGTRFTVTLPSQ